MTTQRTPRCRCNPRPYPLAVFHNGDLITVTVMHNRTRHGAPPPCRLPAEPLNLNDWRQQLCPK